MNETPFFELDADQQVLLALVLALGVSDGLTVNELGILGNFFELLGQNILAIQAVVAACQSAPAPEPGTDGHLSIQLREIRNEVANLKKKIAMLEQRQNPNS